MFTVGVLVREFAHTGTSEGDWIPQRVILIHDDEEPKIIVEPNGRSPREMTHDSVAISWALNDVYFRIALALQW